MLSLEFAKSKMENEEGMNHLCVVAKPKKIDTKVEKPVAFILAIDTSSSMSMGINQEILYVAKKREHQGNKLRFVQDAAERLLDKMQDGHYMGIVTFSDIARIDYPLTKITKDERIRIRQQIRNIQAVGMTNISDALQRSFEQVTDELKKTHHIKIILLSDGQANMGITNIDELATVVQGYRNEDVSISTIGVGSDYNSYLMENIATVSGGMFYHLERMEQLEGILTQELETLSTLTTKHARIKFTLPGGIYVSSNLNGFSEEADGTIYLGNLFSEQDVVVEIYTKDKIEVGEYTIHVRYEYVDEQNSNQIFESSITLPIVSETEMDNVDINQNIVSRVKEFIEAEAKKQALRHYESGDMIEVNRLVSGSLASLAETSSVYGIDMSDVNKELQQLQTDMQTGNLNRERSKIMYAQSYRSTREKK